MQYGTRGLQYFPTLHEVTGLLHTDFPASQWRGLKPLPKNWERGKVGGQDLCNKAEVTDPVVSEVIAP